MGSTPTRSVVRLVVAATAIAILAVACTTSGGGTSSSPSAGASAVPAASSPSTSSGGGRYGSEDEYGNRPSSAPAASADGGSGVHSVGLGNGADGAYLTGADGLTLYVFGNDSANTSTCDGGCATTWPPFTITKGGEITADADVKGRLTTFTRADGSMQVAYDRSPLYYYVDDQAAGDTNGQGVGDVWFIAKP